MAYLIRLIAVLVAFHTIALGAAAGEGEGRRDGRAGLTGLATHSGRAAKDPGTAVLPIDRVADAVDGAESSHGQNVAMWRPDAAGPQGPMQVSEAAATDVGGGDRFDMIQNRVIGRAYLAQLFGRYGNWPDAIAAYNWGIGKMDAWVKAGRPPDGLLAGVATYLRRVLHESGMCNNAVTAAPHRQQQGGAKAAAAPPGDTLVYAACTGPDIWAGSAGLVVGPTQFTRKLEQALQLALQRASQAR